MALSLDAAAEVFREAMRDTVKRYSLWYLIQGVLLIAAGMLAIIYPVLSSAAVVVLLGWLLVISGVVQGLSLIGAGQVPHFWLQLISVILAGHRQLDRLWSRKAGEAGPTNAYARVATPVTSAQVWKAWVRTD